MKIQRNVSPGQTDSSSPPGALKSRRRLFDGVKEAAISKPFLVAWSAADHPNQWRGSYGLLIAPHLPPVDENSRHSTTKCDSHFMDGCIMIYEPARNQKRSMLQPVVAVPCAELEHPKNHIIEEAHDTSWIRLGFEHRAWVDEIRRCTNVTMRLQG